MYFVVFCTDRPGMEQARAACRARHRAYLRAPGPEHPVNVRLGGPTLAEDGRTMNGTMLVVEADGIDAVRRFVDADPYVRAGLFEQVVIRPWAWGLGKPAAARKGWRDRPYAPPPGTPLCGFAELPDCGVREFVFGPGKSPFRMLVIRRGAEIWGYVNNCPHYQIPLNYEPGTFLVMDDAFLMCATHYATFRFEDGFCVDGPCKSLKLEPVPVARSADAVVIGDG